MNLNRIQNDYIERYGEVEGKKRFIDYLEEMEEKTPFPTQLIYSAKKQELKQKDERDLFNQKP